MHVALMHWTLPPTVGGVETHLVDLSNALVAAGANVTLVTGEERPDTSLLPPPLDFLRHTALAAQGSEIDRGEARSLGRLLEAIKPDVLHVHNLFPLAGRPMASVLEDFHRRRLMRLFHTAHSEWQAESDVMDVGSWSGQFAVSQFLSRRLRKSYGRVTAITRLPVDSKRFAATPNFRTPQVLRLLHPARFVPEKGVDLSIAL